jgi:hypothetical protein
MGAFSGAGTAYPSGEELQDLVVMLVIVFMFLVCVVVSATIST